SLNGDVCVAILFQHPSEDLLWLVTTSEHRSESDADERQFTFRSTHMQPDQNFNCSRGGSNTITRHSRSDANALFLIMLGKKGDSLGKRSATPPLLSF